MRAARWLCRRQCHILCVTLTNLISDLFPTNLGAVEQHCVAQLSPESFPIASHSLFYGLSLSLSLYYINPFG